MNGKSSNNNFFQPIISVFGLGVSLITSILPLFSKEILNNLFINKEISQPISFLSFMLGIAIIWQISEFQPYFQINIGKLKNRGKSFPEYWKSFGPNTIIWILLFSNIIISFIFLFLGILFKNIDANSYLGIIQSLVYLLFFLILITIFSILFAQTKNRFIWQENKENFPVTIFETLEKNRLVKPGIEIYENYTINNEELKGLGINTFGIFKKMKIKTTPQKKEDIEFIVSSDGKEIIKVMTKNQIK